MVLGKLNSFLLCFAILIHPVVLTQTRYMYLEIPLLLFTVNAIGYWIRQELGKAILFILLASITKETGFIVGGCIAFYTLFESGTFWRRVIRSVSASFPVLLFVVIYFMYKMAFRFMRIGYANAIAIITLVILLAFSYLQLRVSRSRDET